MLNVVKIGLSVAEILIFFEFSKWPPPPSWILEIAKFYWQAGSRRRETHQHAKFRQNWSIGCKDIKIFRFFQDGGRPAGPPTNRTLGERSDL